MSKPLPVCVCRYLGTPRVLGCGKGLATPSAFAVAFLRIHTRTPDGTKVIFPVPKYVVELELELKPPLKAMAGVPVSIDSFSLLVGMKLPLRPPSHSGVLHLYSTHIPARPRIDPLVFVS